jgi:hypothetical protein
MLRLFEFRIPPANSAVTAAALAAADDRHARTGWRDDRS